jgi:hypothetical protein
LDALLDFDALVLSTSNMLMISPFLLALDPFVRAE